MRKRLVFLANGLLALGLAGPANAAPLSWQGTGEFFWSNWWPAVLAGGGVATVNGSEGVVPAHVNTLRLAASRGGIGGTFTGIMTTPTLWYPVEAVILDGLRLGTGTWTGISGGAASTVSAGGGALPVRGVLKMCLFETSCGAFIPLMLTEPTTVNGVPGTGTKGVGVGGLITAGGIFGVVRVSLQAAPWTIKTATVIDQPGGGTEFVSWVTYGWAHAPVSNTTSTAQPGGVLQFVTPSQVVAKLPPLYVPQKVGSFMVVAIRFIPEPGLLLLLGSGVAGLAFLARRKIRR